MAPPSAFSGRSRSTKDGGSNGVQRSYASQLHEHESLFNTYEHLQGLARGDSAITLLRRAASMVKPIMRKRGWRVQVLAEFLPVEPNLLGLNINRGYKICIRLRYHNHPELFLPLEQIVDTLLHELSHNVFGDHDAQFHRLWDELRDEHETLLMKGFTGEGFLGQGRKLGGAGRMPPPQDLRNLAREKAEKRRKQSSLGLGSGQRLGGTPLHSGQNIREVIAGQALLRTTVNRGCASIRQDASSLADQRDRRTFKTKADEDDANNQAIAEALYGLMEADETSRSSGTLDYTPTDGGLAWSKDHGLYDPSIDESDWDAIFEAQMPTEEEQMRWAVEESKRLAPRGEADTDGLPPESLVSPISPLTAEQVSACSTETPASRTIDSFTVSPVSTRQQNPSRPHPALQHRSSDAQSVSSRTSSVPATPLMDISEPFNPDQWACEICTCINPMQFLACDACGMERPQIKSAPSSSRAGQMRNNGGQRIEPAVVASSRRETMGWNCQSCGTFMEHRWWTCSACGLMKASS